VIAGLKHRVARALDAMRPPARTDERSAPQVRTAGKGYATNVDEYWGEHTINSRPFRNAHESERYLEWRFAQYPLFREFMDLWGDHDGETILDYGCGPGDDTTGFLLHTGAERVIGIDVSAKALSLTRHRLAIHHVDLDRVSLIQTNDSSTSISLPTATVDFINCGGVLHHTSWPDLILREFRRVLRAGGRAHVMVYNRRSVYFHLFTAYQRLIVEDAFPGHTIDEAFRRNTDGPECPISRAYDPATFAQLCESCGFDVEFVGGYISHWDVSSLELLEQALTDERLDESHKAFLRGLGRDERGYPMDDGKYAGIGGVYRLRAS
jgi:ubiquinone/menaquinone biosynthesis C-methylase UbiE